MKHRFLFIVITLAALVACSSAPPAPAPGKRIVSLSPSFTETIFAFGHGKDIVGATVYCTSPPEALQAQRDGRITPVGDLFNPAIETIASLRPTLVIAQRSTHDGKLEALTRLGIDVLILPNTTLEDVFTSIRRVGTEVGESERGERMAASLERMLVRPIGEPRPRVLMTYHADDPASVECIGAVSYQHDILTKLGGINVLADEVAVTPVLNAEEILRRDPDIVVELSYTVDATPMSVRWKRLPLLRAVKNEDLYALHGSDYVRKGPSLGKLIDGLADILARWQARQREAG